MSIRLGDLLVKRGVITPAQQEAILDYQRLTGRPFGELAEKLYNVKESAIEQAWAEQYAALARHIDPRTEHLDPEVLPLIERRQAWQFRILPIRYDAKELMVCTTPQHLVRALKFAGWKIRAQCYFVISEAVPLGEALTRYYPMAGMSPEMIAERRLGVG
jgi:type IV pilus assembly protein PilB